MVRVEGVGHGGAPVQLVRRRHAEGRLQQRLQQVVLYRACALGSPLLAQLASSAKVGVVVMDVLLSYNFATILCNSYLCTYDTYGAVCHVFYVCRSITRASGRGLGPENRDFFGPCKMALSR